MKKQLVIPVVLALLLTACNTSNPSVNTDPTTSMDPSVPSTSFEEPTSKDITEETSTTNPSVDPTTSENKTTSVDPTVPSTTDPTNPTVTQPSVEAPKVYTTTQSKFSSTNGNVGGDNNISYKCYKGGGTSDPAIYDGIIRLYQNASGNYGGYITLTASSGISIVEAVIGTNMSTTIGHTVDNGSMSSKSSLSQGSKYTVNNLSCSEISFYCFGKDKNSRLYVNYLEVKYVVGQGGNVPTTQPSTTTTPSTSKPSTSDDVTSNGGATSYPNIGDTYDGNYYDGIKTTATGLELLSDLRELIVSTHDTYTSYSDCGGGSSKLAKTDGDPNKSGNIILFYSRASVANNKNNFNREHVWPKSTGLWDTSGGGSDMHHIRPTKNNINSKRGNLKFGEVTNGTEASQDGYIGGYYTSSAFEPLDHVKGDVARIILYMFVHYNTGSYLGSNNLNTGSISSTASSKTSGDLPLTNVVTGSKAQAFALMVKWHNEDPVDQLEITRNEEVYKIQGNRNPFIDRPNWVNELWGNN